MSHGKLILTQFPQGFLKALVYSGKQLNQIYFSFLHSYLNYAVHSYLNYAAHSYLNYANIAWDSTQKTKFSTLYDQQSTQLGY